MKKTIIVTFLLTILVSTTLFADGVMPAGSGTANDPYLIATLNNLLYLSTNDDLWVEDIYFSQVADIDASNTQTWNGGAGFSPIGKTSPIFCGNYDGNGHTINNLYINRSSSIYIGLFGRTSGATITNLGVVDADISGSQYVGGLVGSNYSSSEVINSYSTGSVSGGYRVGGLVGSNSSSSTISNSYYDYETVTINDEHIVTRGALPSDMFTAWINNDLSLQIDDYLSSDGNDYLINSFDDFEELLAFAEYPDYSFKLTADLDLSSEPNFYIPFLAASFDGNSHTINNLYININQLYINCIGLFGYTSGATITNLGVMDADITGWRYVGGLVGYNDESSVSNSYSTGSVSGSSYIGGLVGTNYISTINSSYSTSSVTGSSHNVGGLVGYNYGDISNSYNTGSVTCPTSVGGLVGSNSSSSSISNSYSTGSVSGSSYIGGLVGSYSSCSPTNNISNSYYDYETVTINDEHIVTRGALTSDMFTTWVNNDLSLQIDDYLSSDGNDYLINSFDNFEKLLAFAEYPDYSFKLTADLDLSTEPNFYIPFLVASFDGNSHT
ncbi:MAG: GLUG motif-containing protein, partial [Candidatus Cloacimonadota bacterium]|nr:GLUG motif-containing protein [Candidatus Cloacimonadota bacterium]